MSERTQQARKGVEIAIPGHQFPDGVFSKTPNDYKAFSGGDRREVMTKHAAIPGNSSVV